MIFKIVLKEDKCNKNLEVMTTCCFTVPPSPSGDREIFEQPLMKIEVLHGVISCLPKFNKFFSPLRGYNTFNWKPGVWLKELFLYNGGRNMPIAKSPWLCLKLISPINLHSSPSCSPHPPPFPCN